MAKVSLQIYDITNSPSARTNGIIVQINKVMRDGMGVGGIFHGSLEVYGEEWSYGYCETGSGVFSCPPKTNPMYTWRETVELGVTALDEQRVAVLIAELSQKWDGLDYDLLQRNCNHFCDELSQRLGTGSIPAWVNRFAHLGDAAAEFTTSSAIQFDIMKKSVYGASQSAYRYMLGTSESSLSGDRAQARDPFFAQGSDDRNGSANAATQERPAAEKGSWSWWGGEGQQDQDRAQRDELLGVGGTNSVPAGAKHPETYVQQTS